MIRTLIAASLTLLLAGCAHGPTAPEKPFVAQGGIATTVGSASYNTDRIVGPIINIKNEGDNDWRGTLRDQTIDVSFDGSHASGVNLHMQVDQQPNHLTVTGQLGGRMFRFELTPDELKVVTDTRGDTLPRTGPNAYASVNFSGDALDPSKRPEPQFAFALMGTFL